MSEITLLAEVTAFLRQPHGQFIAGHREAGHGAPFAVINPATGEAIAEITAADVGRADRAMESARRAFNQWREMPTLARGALLLKLADTLAEHREELAQLESLCSGKNHHAGADARAGSVGGVFLRYFAGWAGKNHRRNPGCLAAVDGRGEIYRLYPPPAVGRGGRHRTVELLDYDCHLEDGGGAGLRLHYRPSAERVYAADAAAGGGTSESGRYPGWRH